MRQYFDCDSPKSYRTSWKQKSEYDEVFKKHAELNFQIEELFRELNSLKGKKRNASEHKHLQNLITKKRQLMENEISSFESNGQNYEVYKVMLNQIKEIQATMDNLDREAKKRIQYWTIGEM